MSVTAENQDGRRDAPSAAPRRVRPGMVLAASAAVLAALVSPTNAAPAVILGGLVGLLGVALAYAIGPWCHGLLRERRVQRLLGPLGDDPSPHFVTTRGGRQLGHTPAAYALANDGAAPDLVACLAPYVAAPDLALSRMSRDVEKAGTCSVNIRAGPERWKIVAVRRAADLVLFRVERLPDQAASERPGSAACSDLASGKDAASVAGDTHTPTQIDDALPVAILKIDADGTIRFANRAARKLLALEGPEFPPLYDLAEGVGRPVTHWLQEAMNGHGLNRPEIMRSSAGGRELYLQVTLGRIDAGDGPMILATFHDATELKSLEAQFVQSQKMQAIGQLAGGVAHDFNNLLTAISGHCDLLLLRHDEGDPDFADLMQISQNANRAASLVGQLLAFSRKQTMKTQIMDLADTMSDLTHLLNRLVGERIALDLNVGVLRKVIRADRRQFEQVIMNLVVNARDAMPEGGEIRIDVSEQNLSEPLARDRVTLPPGPYISISVTDQGIGIGSDALPKIFEPFYTTKKTGEGTGLGLSTAYGIVKQSGGFIFAESTPGEGSCFTLFFPACDRPVTGADAAGSPRVRGRVPHGEGIVLLVEDEAPVRACAARALRMKGYTVIEAADAEEALERLADPDLRVDLFVTDVIMPGMDGPTWVRRALEERPETRVVFVSGYAEESLAENQARVPNSVFLAKPFSLSDLTTVVHQQLTA